MVMLPLSVDLAVIQFLHVLSLLFDCSCFLIVHFSDTDEKFKSLAKLIDRLKKSAGLELSLKSLSIRIGP